MTIRLERFSFDTDAPGPGTVRAEPALPDEVAEVSTELVHVTGPIPAREEPSPDVYIVLIGLAGQGTVRSGESSFELVAESLARPACGHAYELEVADGAELHCLRVTRSLAEPDKQEMAAEPDRHAAMYASRFADCPTYSQDIKSARTVNRMLLPKGKVPRFCMGSVQTTGPDQVAAHRHPMLDQLFLGLNDCRCTIHADADATLLTGSMLLHIPLGSNHSATVAEGDTLYYVWLDFFRTLDLSWITDQHIIDEK